MFRPRIRMMGHPRPQFRAKADLPVGFPYRFNSSYFSSFPQPASSDFSVIFLQISFQFGWYIVGNLYISCIHFQVRRSMSKGTRRQNRTKLRSAISLLFFIEYLSNLVDTYISTSRLLKSIFRSVGQGNKGI